MGRDVHAPADDTEWEFRERKNNRCQAAAGKVGFEYEAAFPRRGAHGDCASASAEGFEKAQLLMIALLKYSRQHSKITILTQDIGPQQAAEEICRQVLA